MMLIYVHSIPGTLPIFWCCNNMLLRDLCCSRRCMAAVNCEFSTYKSLTNKSELAKRCACSFIIIAWVSNVLWSSLISVRCCCQVSMEKKKLVHLRVCLYLRNLLRIYVRCITDSVYCCCCFKHICNWRFFCSRFCIFWIRLGCGVR